MIQKINKTSKQVFKKGTERLKVEARSFTKILKDQSGMTAFEFFMGFAVSVIFVGLLIVAGKKFMPEMTDKVVSSFMNLF